MHRKKTIIIAVAVIIALYGAFVLFSGPSLAPLNEGMMPLTPMTATTTPTTPPAPNPAVKKTTVPATPKVSAYTVSYTDAGFNPGVIEVKLGSTVTFVNNSNRELSIASTDIGGFGVTLLNQKGSINRGGTFRVTFTGPGTWHYMNRMWQRDGGNIIVK